MDTNVVLKLPKYHRRTFVALLIAIFVIIILLDLRFGGVSLSGIFFAYTSSIAAAIITSLFVLWIAASFFPPPSETGLIEIAPRKITHEFDKLLDVATRWRYKGNFGRYLRGRVLPALAGRQNVHVSACIIDPANLNLCEKHAKYRSQINAIDKGRRYDSDQVAVEILATIVISAWYVKNRRVSVDIYLSPAFDPVRIDSNDQAMILTVEDRRSPALKVTKKHFTYETFELQMEYARNQARKISLDGVREAVQLAEINEADVAAVLYAAGLQPLCQRLTPTRILKACKESRNPYES